MFTTAFTGKAGQLIATTTDNRHFLVQGDVDGDGLADIEISIVSTSFLAGMQAGDFVL